VAEALALDPPVAETVKLDRIDIRILSHLQRNGRISNVDLADAVGLSPSPCLVRVKRLEKAGYIEGYGAQTRLDKLGNVQLVFAHVTLSGHRREDFERFEAGIRHIDEIVECHRLSGGLDYLLKFITFGVAHYQKVLDGMMDRNLNVGKYFSYIVMKTPVKTDYPIEKLLPLGN
jgi:DNA-binding Lrp family transcriptional regulator